MTKVIKVSNCHECPHVSHSGAFTVGGARTICDHDEACRKRGHEWHKRTIKKEDGTPPSWCPLSLQAILPKKVTNGIVEKACAAIHQEYQGNSSNPDSSIVIRGVIENVLKEINHV